MDKRSLSPKIISIIKVLRTNGLSYKEIAKELDISSSTAHKYAQDVIPLPEKLQRDPWDEIQKLEDSPKLEIQEKGDFRNALKQREYWKEEHIEGKPFKGPIELFSLDELIEIMEEPTDYISPLNDNEWYNYYIAPMMFKGKNPRLSNTQIMINWFLNNHKHALVKVFRGAGKTVLVEGRLTRIGCENRKNCYAIQSETKERAQDRLQTVKNNLMGNPRIIAHYGYLPLDKKYKGMTGSWKRDEITVKREIIQTDPTIKAVSWKDARLLGGHFNGILFDDPWSSQLEENNEKNKEKWFRWYDGTLLGCLESGAWQHVICTSKGLYDIYRDLEDRGIFSLYRQPAIWEYPSEYKYIKNEQGKIVDVEVLSDDWHISEDMSKRFSIKFFLMKKAQIRQREWEMEFQLNPLPERGRFFDWKNLKFINGLEEFFECFKRGDKPKVIGAMDMAFGKSDRAHYTALVVVGYFRKMYYLLQAYIKKKTSKLDKAKMIKYAKMDFPMMNTVYVEAD